MKRGKEDDNGDEQFEKAHLPGENQLELRHYEFQTKW